MISIKDFRVSDSDIGRTVVYDPGYKKEVGVITSFNDKYVFVRYGSDIHSKATRRDDLKYEKEGR